MSTPTLVETLPQRKPLWREQDWCGDMRALPTLPSVLFRFLGLVGDPNVSTAELADFIWKDPALLSRALPMVTVLWGRDTGSEGTLRKRIVSLSRERIRNLAFTTPLLRSFEPLGTSSYAITFWERSLLCATASEAVAMQLNLAEPEKYYIAGLLHDLGYLVLLQKRPTVLPAIIQQWAARPSELLEIEEELIGIDHCRLGLQIAARLGLESWMYPAIGMHHAPTADSEPICKVTAIGGAFANCQGIDFYPRRSLSRTTRERELKEIIRVLLPELGESEREQLFQGMEKAVGPIRNAIRETIVEWQVAGESRIQPHFARIAFHPAALPAIA
jgi:HD-like signal output (HDOD) protein